MQLDAAVKTSWNDPPGKQGTYLVCIQMVWPIYGDQAGVVAWSLAGSGPG